MLPNLASLQSPVRLSGSLEFLLVCPECLSDIGYRLLRAEDNRKIRQVRSDFEVPDDRYHVSLGGTRKNNVHFSVEELATGKFRLKLPALGKGECGFLPPTTGVSGRLHTFGIP